MARLFVAAWPASDAVATLAAFERPDIDGLRWTAPEQWHVTLRFLGAVDDVDAARRVFTGIGAAPAIATMGPATGRFGGRILQVPVHGLDAMAAATVTATAGIGQPPDGRPFAGHITLARASGRRVRLDLAPLAGVACRASWPVADITLVASRPGGRYEVIDRLALQP